MRLTFDPARFEFEDGHFPAQFLGVQTFNNPSAIREDGEPMGPGLLWHFLILAGPNMGKKCGRVTPPYPTLKNATGRFIMAFTGKPLSAEAPFDSREHAGNYYMITIQGGRVSDLQGPQFVVGKDAVLDAIVAAFKAIGVVIPGATGAPDPSPDKPSKQSRARTSKRGKSK